MGRDPLRCSGYSGVDVWPSLLSSVVPAAGRLPKADALLVAGALGGAGIRHLRLPEHSKTVTHAQLSIFVQRCKPCKVAELLSTCLLPGTSYMTHTVCTNTLVCSCTAVLGIVPLLCSEPFCIRCMLTDLWLYCSVRTCGTSALWGRPASSGELKGSSSMTQGPPASSRVPSCSACSRKLGRRQEYRMVTAQMAPRQGRRQKCAGEAVAARFAALNTQPGHAPPQQSGPRVRHPRPPPRPAPGAKLPHGCPPPAPRTPAWFLQHQRAAHVAVVTTSAKQVTEQCALAKPPKHVQQPEHSLEPHENPSVSPALGCHAQAMFGWYLEAGRPMHCLPAG